MDLNRKIRTDVSIPKSVDRLSLRQENVSGLLWRSMLGKLEINIKIFGAICY